PGVLPDRRRGRRAGVAARPVRRCAPHRHRRYGVQVLDSRARGVPHLRGDDRHPAVAAAGPVRSARMMHGGGYTVDARIRWPEWLPWTAAAAGLLGALTGAVILRTRALTLLMLTLAITSIILEIANKATWLTGGADGLSGVVVAPILGAFRFDLFGRTAFLYCLAVLFLG